MKKVLGVTAAMLVALPLATSAGEVVGRIQAVDRAARAFVLEDGTRLWLDEGRLVDLREGATVHAIYTVRDGKNVITDLEVRTIVDGTETTDMGGALSSPFDYKSIQTSD